MNMKAPQSKVTTEGSMIKSPSSMGPIVLDQNSLSINLTTSNSNAGLVTKSSARSRVMRSIDEED